MLPLDRIYRAKLIQGLAVRSFILIYDTNKTDIEVVDNQSISQLAGGAGVKAAEALVSKEVNFVISQNFGIKALQVFKTADVKAAVFLMEPLTRR